LNWEDFTSCEELVERLKIHSPLQKESKHWMRYKVQMPSWKTCNRISEDFPQVTGRQLSKTPKNFLQNMLWNAIHVRHNATHIRIPPESWIVVFHGT
jgi:hypothetical protein